MVAPKTKKLRPLYRQHVALVDAYEDFRKAHERFRKLYRRVGAYNRKRFDVYLLLEKP